MFRLIRTIPVRDEVQTAVYFTIADVHYTVRKFFTDSMHEANDSGDLDDDSLVQRMIQVDKMMDCFIKYNYCMDMEGDNVWNIFTVVSADTPIFGE